MGRALFSTRYPPQVTVRTEPQPVCPYEKWSIWNPFDPESDEFNRDAQREVFVDTEAYRQEQEAGATILVADPGSDSSGSSEASDSDRGSPMAVGPDDPAVLISDAYSNVDWEPHWVATTSGTSTEWVLTRAPNTTSETAGDEIRSRLTRPRSTTEPSAPPFLPPPSLRNPTGTDAYTSANAAPTTPPTSATRPIVPPISIPNESFTAPGPPAASTSPTTPTNTSRPPEMHALLTPSPPPSVTPHLYTWRRITIGAPPTSPSGPLTNPSARRSLARISNIAPPARVRIQNAAV